MVNGIKQETHIGVCKATAMCYLIKMMSIHNGGKTASSSNGDGKIMSTCRGMKLDPYLPP